jgi:hypothetical protein
MQSEIHEVNKAGDSLSLTSIEREKHLYVLPVKDRCQIETLLRKESY